MTTTPIPSPLALAARFKAPEAVRIDTEAKAKPFVASDPGIGVIRAKRLKKGMVVRPWSSKGGPRGAAKTVESIERVNDGASVLITWSSAHVPETRPAAYRFHSEALAAEGFIDEVGEYSGKERRDSDSAHLTYSLADAVAR